MPPPTAPSPAPPAQPAPQLRLELRSNALLLAGARDMISAVAKRFGFPDESCAQIALAVDEALCNVIKHGYGRDPSRPIWITVFAIGNGWEQASRNGADGQLPDALRVVVEDEAPQVDPTQIKSRDLDEVRPGGLGVHIIKTVMDEAVYERREKVGMRLTMLKKRVGSKAVPAGACTEPRGHGGEGDSSHG